MKRLTDAALSPEHEQESLFRVTLLSDRRERRQASW